MQFLKSAYNKTKNFVKDRYNLLFKGAAVNHLRIQDALRNSDGTYQLTIKFNSYTELKRYQKKLRRVTVSLSSAVAMMLIVAIIAPSILNPKRSSAAGYAWTQTNWTSAADPMITYGTQANKDTFYNYAQTPAKDSEVVTSADTGGSLTQSGTDFALSGANPDVNVDNTQSNVQLKPASATTQTFTQTAGADWDTYSGGKINVVKSADASKVQLASVAAGWVQNDFVTTGLNNPSKNAIDASGRIYFFNQGDGTIKRYSSAGVLDATFNVTVANPQGGLAVDANGNVYAGASTLVATGSWVFDGCYCDAWNYDDVYDCNDTDNENSCDWDGGSSLDHSYYTGDTYSYHINKYNSSGVLQTTFESSVLNMPNGIAIAGSGSNLTMYVANAGTNTIEKFTSSNAGTNWSYVNAVATGLNAPNDVAVDGVGNVYFVETGYGYGHGTLKKYDGSSVTTLISTLERGRGLYATATGDVYVANDINIIKYSGGVASIVTSAGIGTPDSAYYPADVLLDAGGNLIVDIKNKVLKIVNQPAGYALTGTFTSVIDGGALSLNPTWSSFKMTRNFIDYPAGNLTSAGANDKIIIKAISNSSATVAPTDWTNACTINDSEAGNAKSLVGCGTVGTGRYLWYQASLTSTDATKSPTLDQVEAVGQVPSYQANGVFESSVIDIGQAVTTLGNVSWNSTDNGGTTKFQIASSIDGSTWTAYQGPTSVSDYYTTSSGQSINSAHNGARYVRYKAFLSAPVTPIATPILSSVTISYVKNGATDNSLTLASTVAQSKVFDTQADFQNTGYSNSSTSTTQTAGRVELGPAQSSLVAGYHFNETSGTTAADFSGNGNTLNWPPNSNTILQDSITTTSNLSWTTNSGYAFNPDGSYYNSSSYSLRADGPGARTRSFTTYASGTASISFYKFWGVPLLYIDSVNLPISTNCNNLNTSGGFLYCTASITLSAGTHTINFTNLNSVSFYVDDINITGTGMGPSLIGQDAATKKYATGASAKTSTGSYLTPGSAITLGNEWTVSAWVYGNGSTSIAGLYNNSTGYTFDPILIDSSNSNSPLGLNIRGSLDIGFGTFSAGLAHTSNASWASAGWHLITAVGYAGRTDFYCNGTSCGNAFSQITNTTMSYIGNISSGVGYAGNFDDLLVFNKALSASEISSIYSSGSEYVKQMTYPSPGTYTSGIVNMGLKVPVWGNMSWVNAAVTNPGTIAMQARSCADSTCSTNPTYCAVTSGQTPSCVVAGDQYFQYKATLTQTSSTNTPSLDSVTINYSTYPTTFKRITSSPFDTGDTGNSVSIDKVAWKNGGLTPNGGTVKMQVRAADTLANLQTKPWCGPNVCDGSEYFTNSSTTLADGTPLKNTATGGQRFIQYSVLLSSSSDGSVRPSVDNVTLNYSFNTPPVVTITDSTLNQKADGSLDVNYKISDTPDDIAIGQTTDAVGLFYQMDDTKKLNLKIALDGATTPSVITLDNQGNYPVPSSGTILVGTELIHYTSATVDTNLKTVTLGGTIIRNVSFDDMATTGGTYKTKINSHNIGAEVLLLGKNLGTKSGLTILATTPQQTTNWNPKVTNPSLVGNAFANMKVMLAASDGDATLLNSVGTANKTLTAPGMDLQAPTISNIINADNLTKDTSYNFNKTIPIKLSFSENITSVGVSAGLSNGKSITCSDVLAASAQSYITCNYTVGSGEDSNTDSLWITGITGTVNDKFSNVANVTIGTGKNLSDQTYKTIIDNTIPTTNIVSPGNGVFTKVSNVAYSLSEQLASGSIVFTSTTTKNGETTSPRTCDMKAGLLTKGNHSGVVLDVSSCTNAVNLVSENMYNLYIAGKDLAGNDIITNDNQKTNITFDTTAPTLSITSLNDNGIFNNFTDASDVSFSFSEKLQLAAIKFTKNSVDTICNLSGTELEAGNHNNVNLVNICGGLTLEDGAYDITLSGTDLAGNVGSENKKTNVTYDTIAPLLSSFTSTTPNVLQSNGYGADSLINVEAVFAEDIADGSTMTVRIENSANPSVDVVLAKLNSRTLSGNFTVQGPRKGYDTQDLNIKEIISENVVDMAGNVKSDLVIPVGQNLKDTKDIVIDTGAATLLSFAAKKLPNITSGAFKNPNQIQITANYSKPIASGAITIRLNTNNNSEKNSDITLNNISGSSISGNYNVAADDNADDLKVTSIISQNATDFKGNPLTETGTIQAYDAFFYALDNTIAPVTNIVNFQIDNIAPVITITDDVNPNPNQLDNVTFNIDEKNLVSAKYIFTTDTDCANKAYDGGIDFASNTPIVFNTEEHNGKYLCTKALDNAGNFFYLATTNKLNIDVAAPNATLQIDRSKTSEQINLTAADKDRDNLGMQMKIQVIEDATTACDLSLISWAPYVQMNNLNSSANFVKVCASLKDSAGNVLDEISAVTPINPENYTFNDLTSATFAGFAITWSVPSEEGTSGFDKYLFNWCKSSDTSDCTPNQADEITDKNQNYNILKDLDRSKKYCFNLNFQDKNGDISNTSGTSCSVPGEGPVVANADVKFESDPLIASITKNSAKVIFKTINAADNVPLATNAKLEVFSDPALTTLVKTVNDSLNMVHMMSITGLQESTPYYLKITATETSPAANQEVGQYNVSSPDKYYFSTAGILTSITNIKESLITSDKAVITFITNQDAKCFIDYKDALSATYNELSNNIESGFFTNHTITLTQLLPVTNYDYKITCADESNVVITSDEHHFVTVEKGLTQSEADAASDKNAPSISAVSIGNVTGESVTVTWNTNEKANSLVTYEVSGAGFSMMAGDDTINSDKNNYSTSHSVVINNLIPDTKYLFNVLSIDLAGNIGTSSQSTFTTKAPSSLSSIKVVSTALGQATVTWSTSNSTTSTVEYGLTTAYGQTKQDNASVKDHSINLADLTPGNTYHFRVMGEDSNKNIFASSDITFQPKAPPVISNFNVDAITEHGATITFGTNVGTDVLITYDDIANTENSGVQGNPVFTIKHEIKLKELASGETFGIKVKVRDEDGNETEETFQGFTTAKDENPPKIDMVKTDTALTQNDKVQAIISWSTDELATGKVIYKEGKAEEERTFNVNDALSFSHIGVITSFKTGTVYYFKVVSADQVGNKATSTDFAVLTPKKKQNIIQIIIGNFSDIFGWAKF